MGQGQTHSAEGTGNDTGREEKVDSFLEFMSSVVHGDEVDTPWELG